MDQMADRESVIEVRDLTKIYHLYDSPAQRLQEILLPWGRKRHREFYALDHVSFQAERGCAIGIIGSNGSGKSTLLKILSGVLEETEGMVAVRGRVSALLELGAGFHPEYTGLENIRQSCMLEGCSAEETEAKMDSIRDFAQIGEYIHQPVKNYSSGMFARLAFSAAIHTDPDILIVDEALSVGDIRFQQKCFRKMQAMKQGKTVLLVTHDMGAVMKYCDRAIWLEKGKVMADGAPADVIRQYQAYLSNSAKAPEKMPERPDKDVADEVRTKAAVRMQRPVSVRNRMLPYQLEAVPETLDRYGEGGVSIMAVGLYRRGDPMPVHLLQGGEELEFVMQVRMDTKVADPIAGLTVSDRLGTQLFGMNSYLIGAKIDGGEKDQLLICRFRMPQLNEGIYTISPAYASGTQSSHTMLQWLYDAYEFQMTVPFEKPLEGVLAVTDFSYRVVPMMSASFRK